MNIFRKKNLVLLRGLKIRTRIVLILISILILFLTALIILGTNYSVNLVNGYIYDYVESSQQQILTSVELIIDEISMLTLRLKTNANIYETIANKKLSYREKEERIQYILRDILKYNAEVGGVLVADHKDNSYVYFQQGIEIEEPKPAYYQRIKKTGPTSFIWGKAMKGSDGKAYIPCGAQFYNFYTSQSIGYIVVYINEDTLYNVYKNALPNLGYSFIVNEDQYILSHGEKEMIGLLAENELFFEPRDDFSYKFMSYNDEMYIVAMHSSGERQKILGASWTIASIISKEKLFKVITTLNRYMVYIGITALLLAFILSVLISRRVTKSLNKLKERVNNLDFSNLESLTPISSKLREPRDEIWELEKSYDDMVARIRELIIKNNEEKEKQREMELTALQAQINPHFLYNTLDTIAWIAKLKKQDEIERTVIELATFFRLSLHKGDKFIKVEEEIQLIKSFVAIEQVRSPDQFNINYDISENIKDQLILKLTLQPLVENAIKHGVTQKEGKGNIFLKGVKKGTDMIFYVKDDGAGFNIGNNQEIPIPNCLGQSGYGLKNVDDRIKLEYGQNYGISIKSYPNKGTEVTVHLGIKD